MPFPSPACPATSWRDVAEQQEGVLGRAQALALGMSEDQWQWRYDSGRWRAVLPGVAVTHSGEVTARQRAWAALIYAGPGACLSGDAALVELGLCVPSVPVITVAVPEGRKVASQAFTRSVDHVLRGPPPLAAVRRGAGSQMSGALTVEPHRVRGLEAWRHPVRRPDVVRIAPAVLHAAAWAPSDRGAEWRVAAAVQQRLVLPRDLRGALASMPRIHRRRLIATVLDDVELGAHAASELDFLRFLRRHGLPRPDRLQRPLRQGRLRYLDAWWERPRVSAEIDGAHHRSVGTWDEDTLRANDVVVTERYDRIVLLRFTAGNLRHDGPRVAAQLAAVIL